MTEQDVERIVRAVLLTKGVNVALRRVAFTGTSWLVILKDPANRILGFDVPDGSPAAVREATERWTDVS